jgi:hypothetical protein
MVGPLAVRPRDVSLSSCQGSLHQLQKAINRVTVRLFRLLGLRGLAEASQPRFWRACASSSSGRDIDGELQEECQSRCRSATRSGSVCGGP